MSLDRESAAAIVPGRVETAMMPEPTHLPGPRIEVSRTPAPETRQQESNTNPRGGA